MTRKEIISSPTYWLTQIQLAIFRCADKFMTDKEMNRTKLAEHLGVTKGHVTQMLAGDYNYSLSKLVETTMKMGYAVEIKFTPIEQVIQNDVLQTGTLTTNFKSLYYNYNNDLSLEQTA